MEYDRKLRKKFLPINIIYEPVKFQNKKINCFFSNEMHFAYRSTFSEGNRIKHSSAWQCHYCSNYYAKKSKFGKHLEDCSGQPGIVCDFDIQNLVTYEYDIKYKSNIPLVAYIDFETTPPTDSCLNLEQFLQFILN